MSGDFISLGKFEFTDARLIKETGISMTTRKALVNHRAIINTTPVLKGMAYSKKKPKHRLYFQKGYDILQYNIVVRDFILRLYNINKEIELDILLYLFPFHFFTREDFMVLPTRSRGYNLKKMMSLGYIEITLKKSSNCKAPHIYALTKLSKDIVRNYYKYLSGEKVIKEGGYKNPFRDKPGKKIDREREALMLRLANQIERNPEKFKDSFY